MPLSSIPPEQLRFLIQDTAAVTWTLGADGYVLNVPQWSALTGQQEDEIEGNGWLNAIHTDDRDRVSAAWNTAIAHGQHFNTDYRIRCVDGVYRWFNARGTPLRSVDGEIERWVGVCLEIPGLWRFRGMSGPVNDVADESAAPLDPSIIRSGRAMLNWTAAKLSQRSGVSVSTIRRLESDESDIQSRRTSTDKLMRAFLDAGLVFIDGDGRITGVRWAARNNK